MDVFSGSGTGGLYWFRRKAKGEFGARELVRDRTGKPFSFDDEVGAHAGDWDGDGDLDLLVGTRFGQLLVIRNERDSADNAFGRPRPLLVRGTTLRILTLSAPLPLMADWDGDGDTDLLVGTGRGEVLWFQNSGTIERPELSPGQILVDRQSVSIDASAKAAGITWGTFARPFITDWNGDGKLDLLVGDHHNPESVAKLSKAEEEQLESHLADFRAEWAAAFREYRHLSDNRSESSTQREKLPQRSILREQMGRLKREISNVEKQLGIQVSPAHGYVWLLLRK